MVMRLPSRSRCTSLPSLTARRPKVDSAISAWRQNSEIWLRISSFFIAPDDWDGLVGSGGVAGVSYHHLPTLETWSGRSPRRRHGLATVSYTHLRAHETRHALVC